MELEALFALCSGGCKCGIEPCPMAKKQRCPVCKEIKNGKCRKESCKPLMLTYQPPAAPPSPLALPPPQWTPWGACCAR